MIQFPLAYVLSKHTSLQASGIWWSFPVTNVLTGLIALCWFARGDWTAGKLTEEVRQIVQVTDETIVEEGIR